MPKKTSPPLPIFEELYNELETTIEKLETGNLPLDDALAIYERGMELAKQCSALLDRAELKIQELTPDTMDAAGFEADEADLDDEDE